MILLQPTTLNGIALKNRIVMAPMTRSFADDETGNVTAKMHMYYQKKAESGIGLIITEGIAISPTAKGTYRIPGLYTNAQTIGWQEVVKKVHQANAKIIAQLWHVGRLSHVELIGTLPFAPSVKRAKGLVHQLGKPYSLPMAMTLLEIKTVLSDYQLAAENAMRAGFDGVELHAAHGYLIDQFNSETTNFRQDDYGGPLKNRLKFMEEVIARLIVIVGSERLSIRFSSKKDDDDMYKWLNFEETLTVYLDLFKKVGVKILHPSSVDYFEKVSKGWNFYELVRQNWQNTIIGVGQLTPISANQELEKGIIDLAAFGRPILRNPDFVKRVCLDEKLRKK